MHVCKLGHDLCIEAKPALLCRCVCVCAGTSPGLHPLFVQAPVHSNLCTPGTSPLQFVSSVFVQALVLDFIHYLDVVEQLVK
jgi:hypothetical protein